MEAIQRDEVLQSIGIQPVYFTDDAKDKMLAVIESDPAVVANSYGGSIALGIAEMNYVQRACLRERVMTAVLQKS